MEGWALPTRHTVALGPLAQGRFATPAPASPSATRGGGYALLLAQRPHQPPRRSHLSAESKPPAGALRLRDGNHRGRTPVHHRLRQSRADAWPSSGGACLTARPPPAPPRWVDGIRDGERQAGLDGVLARWRGPGWWQHYGTRRARAPPACPT